MIKYQPQTQPATMMQAQPQRTLETERCCCCCSLESGLKVTGIIYIVLGIFMMIFSSVGIHDPDSVAFDGTTGHSPDPHYENLMSSIFSLVIGILLFVGATNRDTGWCFGAIVLVILNFISVRVGTWMKPMIAGVEPYIIAFSIIGFIIFLLIFVYIIYAIYTYITLLNGIRGQVPMMMGPMGVAPSQQQSYYQPAAPNANYSQNQVNPGYPRPQPTYSQNQLNPQPSQPT